MKPPIQAVALALLGVPAPALAHHSVEEDSSLFGPGVILWGFAALAFLVITALGWISSRRRRDDDGPD